MKKRMGFTLVELMVVVTMVFIISMALYAPYVYYQNKLKLRVASKEIAQSLYEAKNMAINGFSDTGITVPNISVGIYFDADLEPNKFTFFSYPYSYSGSDIGVIPTADTKILKKEELPPGVQIDSIGGYKKGLFYFSAIYGAGAYYYYVPPSTTKQEFASGVDTISIQISYKGSTSSNLQKNIDYYTPTQIIDY